MALETAKEEAKLYRGLLDKAESAVREIESELAHAYQPKGSRFTDGELADVRRDILAVLSFGWTAPREIVDRLCEYSSDLVLRELHKLSNNPRSDVVWNQRKGSASRYRRYKREAA